MAINIYKNYTLDELRDALMQSPESAEVATDAVVVLCGIVSALDSRVASLEERNARLEVYVSELRYKAGITEVDEVREQFLNAEDLKADRCESIGAGQR
jgi:hypothetical protein